jgi:hypothetical protein
MLKRDNESQNKIMTSNNDNLDLVMQGSFSRPFVEYMLKSHVGQTLLQWLGDTGVPDETFWATLNYNPSLRAPGSYLGNIL